MDIMMNWEGTLQSFPDDLYQLPGPIAEYVPHDGLIRFDINIQYQNLYEKLYSMGLLSGPDRD